MTRYYTNYIFREIAETIDIPDSAYDKAERRYKDLGEWFHRRESKCFAYDPHIYPQGSFRLGTVMRPIGQEDEYDLDIGIRLRSGISKETHTQKQLKNMVGADLEEYRIARQIKHYMQEKRRCWRLKYADILNFHLDAVPSIPETVARRRLLKESMIRFGSSETLAIPVVEYAGAITDNHLNNYDIINNNWRISNSEGYALWFESRMKQAQTLLEKRAFEMKSAQIDDLPAYRWKTPLQTSIQILKRHRDLMFKNKSDSKPISIIITTLAGLAYQGEMEIAEALIQILSRMGHLVKTDRPRIPNPVNPEEDFADKWDDPQYKSLELENSFRLWLEQARNDFDTIRQSKDPEIIVENAQEKYAATLNVNTLRKALLTGGGGKLLKTAVTPDELRFPDKAILPKKPAGFAL